MNEIWKMKDGTEIEVCNMTNHHIQSCKSMLMKDRLYGFGIHNNWIEIFDEVLEYRKSELRQKKLESL